jgi:perosamine synthetase
MTEARIPWATPTLWGNEEAFAVDALRSTWISGGPYVERLEREFARYCDVGHVVAVANGTAALHLAYLALGISPGDEIVVPGFAFMAAANVAILAGAKPVFAEVDPDTWCVTAESIGRCIGKRTRAVVPVQTYGNMCEMDAINKLADTHGITVIEDAAESIGSRYRGRMAGSFAKLGTFSFHATKTITTGEGGAVATDDDTLAERLRLYRSHGMASKRYWHEVAGHNFRMTNLQAAIGCAQLERIDAITASRREVHAAYTACLDGQPGIRLQSITASSSPLLWAIAVRLSPERFPQGRDQVMEQMAAAGIECRPGFYPASAMPHVYGRQQLPVCEDIAASVLVLPSSPVLRHDDVRRVCDTLVALVR